MSIILYPNKPILDAGFPTAFVPSPAPTWTITGLSNIESVTNFSVYFPSINLTVGIWVMLPAGYTSGSFDCATIGFQHGASSTNDNGAGTFSDSLPAAYNDAVAKRVLTTPVIMWGYHGTRYSMGTNTPTNSPIENIALLAYKWVHDNYRCFSITDVSKHVRMGFSMGGRECLYHFFKQAKLFYEGKSQFCWGGVVAFGPPVYDEAYGYAADAGITDWSVPCISPSSAFTASELAIWATKTAQYWISPGALTGKLIRVIYGQGDPVLAVPGTAWNTRMNSSGIKHDFASGIPKDGSSVNISHNVTNYLQANGNITRPAFSRIQSLFNGTL